GLTQGVATAPAALRSPDKRSASGRAHGSAAIRNTGRFPIPYSRSAPRPASGRRGRSAACAPWRASDAALPPTAEGTRMRFAYPGYAEASPRVARPWRRHGAQTVPLCLEAKGGPGALRLPGLLELSPLQEGEGESFHRCLQQRAQHLLQRFGALRVVGEAFLVHVGALGQLQLHGFHAGLRCAVVAG